MCLYYNEEEMCRCTLSKVFRNVVGKGNELIFPSLLFSFGFIPRLMHTWLPVSLLAEANSSRKKKTWRITRGWCIKAVKPHTLTKCEQGVKSMLSLSRKNLLKELPFLSKQLVCFSDTEPFKFHAISHFKQAMRVRYIISVTSVRCPPNVSQKPICLPFENLGTFPKMPRGVLWRGMRASGGMFV